MISDVLGNSILVNDFKSADKYEGKGSHKSSEASSVLRKSRASESVYPKIRQHTHKRKDIDGSKTVVSSSVSTKRIASHITRTRQTGQSKKDELSSRDFNQSRSKLTRRDQTSGIPVVHGKRSDVKSNTGRGVQNKSEKGRGENTRKSLEDADQDIKCNSATINIDTNGNLGTGPGNNRNLNLPLNEKQPVRKTSSRSTSTHIRSSSEALPKNISKISKSGKCGPPKASAKEIRITQSRIPHSASSKSVNKPCVAISRKAAAWPGMPHHTATDTQCREKRAGVHSHSSKASYTRSQLAEGGDCEAASHAEKPLQVSTASGGIPSGVKEALVRQEKTPNPGQKCNLHACVPGDCGQKDHREVLIDSRQDSHSSQHCVERKIKSAGSQSASVDINNAVDRPTSLNSSSVASAKKSCGKAYKSQVSPKNPLKQEVGFDENTSAKIAVCSKNKVLPSSSNTVLSDSILSPTESYDENDIAGSEPNVKEHEKCTQRKAIHCDVDSRVQTTAIALIKESVSREINDAPGKASSSKLPISRSSSLRSVGTGNSIYGIITSQCNDNKTIILPERVETKGKTEKPGGGKASVGLETKEQSEKTAKCLTNSPKFNERANHGNKVVRHESGFRKLANLAKHLSQQWNKPRTYIQTRQEPRQTKSDTTLLQERKYAQRERDNLYGYPNTESNNKSKSLFSRSKCSNAQMYIINAYCVDKVRRLYSMELTSNQLLIGLV